MTQGLAAAHANAILNVYRGTTLTGITLYIQLHNGDPGAAGTSNVSSAVSGRQSASFSAASGGSMSLSSTPTAWSVTATDTITNISLWDASSSGNFIRSAVLTTGLAVLSGDTYAQTVLTFSYTPIAA